MVAVTWFGSIWRWRSHKGTNQSNSMRETAYYNTTGVTVSGVTRQRPKIVGYARFNGTGGFDPNYPSRMSNRVFECADPCVWQGQNKLLFKPRLNTPETPEGFLVVVRSELVGKLHVGSTNWCSGDTWLIALSECQNQQEAILPMPASGWTRSELGRFVLEPRTSCPWMGRLVLVTGG